MAVSGGTQEAARTLFDKDPFAACITNEFGKVVEWKKNLPVAQQINLLRVIKPKCKPLPERTSEQEQQIQTAVAFVRSKPVKCHTKKSIKTASQTLGMPVATLPTVEPQLPPQPKPEPEPETQPETKPQPQQVPRKKSRAYEVCKEPGCRKRASGPPPFGERAVHLQGYCAKCRRRVCKRLSKQRSAQQRKRLQTQQTKQTNAALQLLLGNEVRLLELARIIGLATLEAIARRIQQ